MQGALDALGYFLGIGALMHDPCHTLNTTNSSLTSDTLSAIRLSAASLLPGQIITHKVMAIHNIWAIRLFPAFLDANETSQ